MNDQPVSRHKAGLAEACDFRARHPDIGHFDAFFIDISGRPRGKRCPIEKLESLYDEGIQSPQSHFLLDVNGDSSNPLGRGFSDGDPDTTLVPVPGSLVPVPWSKQPLARVIVGERPEGRDGSLADPRQLLRKAAEPLAGPGLKPVMAVELEFFLFEPEPDAEGRPRIARRASTGRKVRTDTNSIAELDSLAAFFADVDAFCRVQGVPATMISSEMGAGQFEINLRHGDDPLAAADHGVLLRRIVAAAAERHGMRASFMAKPFLESPGSGMHVHLSLADRAGRNAFDDGSAAGSALLSQAIAGLQQTMPDCLALFAPNVNALRRFGPMQFVPLNRDWGYNNRGVAFRVPAGPCHARRIEHRVAGADANPHLVLAAILAGVHHGIANKLEPDKAKERAGEDAADPGLSFDLDTALARLEASPLIARYIDADYLKVYAAVKRDERARFLDFVSTREYDWYL
jgi:glutamine synthetase